MARIYDQIDASWSWNGDYELDSSGDLLDTSDDQIEAVRQRIADLIRCEIGDWELAPYNAVGLGEFIGRSNTRATAERARKKIFGVLTERGRIAPEDLNIKIVPITPEQSMIMLALRAAPTVNNSLEEGFLRFSFIYTFGTEGIFL